MTSIRSVCFVLAPLAFLMLAGAVVNSSGALPGYTGAPGEGNCTTCHNAFGVNSGAGTLEIEAPDTYEPGDVVEVRVTLTHGGAVRHGFEIAAKNAEDNHVGSFELVDSRTRFTGVGNDYVTHSQANEVNAWTVQWTAPPTDAGEVTFYAAGNAANGDGGPTGDYIYTTRKRVSASTGTGREEEVTPGLTVYRAYPNPFVDRATVTFDLDGPAAVVLTVYDALGRVVRVVDPGVLAAGRQELHVEADGLVPGLYLYELRTPTARVARPLMRFE